MSAIQHLYIAYAVTWIIHLGYIGYLTRRFCRVRRDVQEFHSRK